MSAEERLIEAIAEDDDEDEIVGSPAWREKQRRRLGQKNRSAINRFLGKSRRTNHVAILPRYYGELLTWALHRYLEREEWKITATLGYRGPEPVFVDVNTGDETENLLMDGQTSWRARRRRKRRWRTSSSASLLLPKKKISTGARISSSPGEYASWMSRTDHGTAFKDRSWDSIVLDADTKREIKANTVDFLKRSSEWEKYGIPLKRGVLLAGEPGTGKTIICRALMAEADGITCITTNGYALDDDDYVTERAEPDGVRLPERTGAALTSFCDGRG